MAQSGGHKGENARSPGLLLQADSQTSMLVAPPAAQVACPHPERPVSPELQENPGGSSGLQFGQLLKQGLCWAQTACCVLSHLQHEISFSGGQTRQ
jgi:hypothetical protein